MSIEAIASRWRKPWPGGDALLVGAVLVLATASGLLLQDSLSLASLALLYVLAVVVAAQFASLAGALACTAAALALLNFFFVPPRFDLRIDARENLAALAAMLAVSLVISHRSAALRRETAAARASEARAGQLQRLATALAVALDEAAVHALAARALAEAAPQEREGSEHARAIQALADQALRRVQAGAAARAAEDKARWRRAQNTFLAGLSHDLRTPLSPIVTAASSLLTQRSKLDAGEQRRLAEVILAEAAHLATLTENALHLARLEDAGGLRLDWQSIEEIVGAVLRRVRQRAPGRQITARVPSGLPLVRADAVLLAQVLDNLLDNALRYTLEPIELVVTRSDACLQVSVQDRGAGIPAGEARALFEPEPRGDRSGARGAGLGLVVGRAVARAHGGELLHAQRQGGGSVFTLRLPVDPEQPALEIA